MPRAWGDVAISELIDETDRGLEEEAEQRHVPFDPLVAPLGLALLRVDQGGVDVEGVLGHSIPAEQAGSEGVPDLAETDQPSLTHLGIAHPPEPVAHRVRIGEDVVVEQREERRFAFQRPEVFERSPAGLEHQDECVNEHRRRIAPVAPGTGEMLLSQSSQPEPVVVLGHEG